MVLFILLFLVHVIDDFVLQPVCLSKLKQRDWWKQHEEGCKDMYKHDYLMALAIHAFSWSAWIALICSFYTNTIIVTLLFIFNGFIHFIVDNLKANKKVLNLIQDQLIHLVQLAATTILVLL